MNVFDLPVHPQADIFPMLPDDEMQELAADIKTNGLNIPVVLGEYEGEIYLIDGRNRREACRIAGVEPDHQMLNGQDQTAYIASSNLNRRHMTKSQKAMAMAMLYPEPKRGMHSELKNSTGNFDKGYLSMARKVLSVLPMNVKEVIGGGTSLSDAYQQARDLEDKSNSIEVRMKRLRNEYPDLADRVDTESLTLVEAETLARQREAEAKMQRELKMQHFYQLNNIASLLRTPEHIEAAGELFGSYKNEFEKFTQRSLDEFLKEVEVVEANIGTLKSIIKENI